MHKVIGYILGIIMLIDTIWHIYYAVTDPSRLHSIFWFEVSGWAHAIFSLLVTIGIFYEVYTHEEKKAV